MILGALVSIFPFYWMFVVATNDKDAAFHIPRSLRPERSSWITSRAFWSERIFQGIDELGRCVFSRYIVRCVPLYAGGLRFCQV